MEPVTQQLWQQDCHEQSGNACHCRVNSQSWLEHLGLPGRLPFQGCRPQGVVGPQLPAAQGQIGHGGGAVSRQPLQDGCPAVGVPVSTDHRVFQQLLHATQEHSDTIAHCSEACHCLA